VALLTANVVSLRKGNETLSKRRGLKTTRVRQGGSHTVEKARDDLNEEELGGQLQQEIRHHGGWKRRETVMAPPTGRLYDPLSQRNGIHAGIYGIKTPVLIQSLVRPRTVRPNPYRAPVYIEPESLLLSPFPTSSLRDRSSTRSTAPTLYFAIVLRPWSHGTTRADNRGETPHQGHVTL